MALMKLYNVRPLKARNIAELSKPPTDSAGGHHMLLQWTVINDIHLIIPVNKFYHYNSTNEHPSHLQFHLEFDILPKLWQHIIHIQGVSRL